MPLLGNALACMSLRTRTALIMATSLAVPFASSDSRAEISIEGIARSVSYPRFEAVSHFINRFGTQAEFVGDLRNSCRCEQLFGSGAKAFHETPLQKNRREDDHPGHAPDHNHRQ